MILKFRAWDCDARKMTSWQDLILEKSENKDRILIGYKKNKAITNFDHKMILMQSTGLKDKNGTEIYEGDVVEVLKGFLNVIDYRQDDGCWRLKPLDEQFACSYFSNYDNKFEWLVIGNIYENMELLEIGRAHV